MWRDFYFVLVFLTSVWSLCVCSCTCVCAHAQHPVHSLDSLVKLDIIGSGSFLHAVGCAGRLLFLKRWCTYFVKKSSKWYERVNKSYGKLYHNWTKRLKILPRKNTTFFKALRMVQLFLNRALCAGDSFWKSVFPELFQTAIFRRSFPSQKFPVKGICDIHFKN